MTNNIQTNNIQSRHVSSLPAELEARIQHLEKAGNQGSGFTQADWLWLWGLGIAAPIALLIWGWI